MGDVDGDVDLVVVDVDGAVVAGGREVVEGRLACLVGVEGERSVASVSGEVDRLSAGACGGLGFVDRLDACGEGETAVDDESCEEDQSEGEDDDERGDRAVLPAAAR